MADKDRNNMHDSGRIRNYSQTTDSGLRWDKPLTRPLTQKGTLKYSSSYFNDTLIKIVRVNIFC